MMEFKNLITSFVRNWNFARNETTEILQGLDNKQLQFKPRGSDKWQPLSFQFACMAVTQLTYARAIEEGKMKYEWFKLGDSVRKKEYKSKEELMELLNKGSKQWIEAIRRRRREEGFKISWPGFNMGLAHHISALISHERLHQGQIISYFTLMGIEFPKNFKQNWAL